MFSDSLNIVIPWSSNTEVCFFSLWTQYYWSSPHHLDYLSLVAMATKWKEQYKVIQVYGNIDVTVEEGTREGARNFTLDFSP